MGSSFLMARNAVGAVNSDVHAVLGDDPPERAGVGRADRLALVQDRGAAGEQRRVDDVGVADDPADVGGGPEHLARVRRRRRSACSSAARRRGRRCRGRRPWAGRSCPTCRGCRADRWPRPGRSRPGRRRPWPRPSRGRGRRPARPSPSAAAGSRSASGRCVACSIAASSSGLYAMTRAPSMPHEADTTTFGSGVVDAHRQLVGREAAEHHRVDGAQAGAGEHGDDRLGHHRHVDDHAVALARRRARRARRRSGPPRRAARDR